MSGKFALIIGNTEYIDPGLAQLTAPGRDAEDFARILKDKGLCAFDEVNVLVNQLSSSAIEMIDGFFDGRKPDDLLVLYFSGHGVRDELGSLYLAFKNTIRSRLRSTAIKSDYIREAMDQSRSKRQVLILDCCNSGAFPQGTKAEIGGAMGMTKAFQGYGRFVLTASDATQFAWEGDKIIGETNNSLFTHFLVKGLEGDADSDGDGKITVDELYDYAFAQISSVTPNQTPTKSAAKQEGEIILRQTTRMEDIKPLALPNELISEIENPYPEVRLRAVQQLTKLLNGNNLGLARSAKEALKRMEKEDDSRRVSQAATQALESIRQTEQALPQRAEEDQSLASARTGQLHRQQMEQEAGSQVEKTRLEKPAEEAEEQSARLATEEVSKVVIPGMEQKSGEERPVRESDDAERKALERRMAYEKSEVERKTKQEAERLGAQKARQEQTNREASERIARQNSIRKYLLVVAVVVVILVGLFAIASQIKGININTSRNTQTAEAEEHARATDQAKIKEDIRSATQTAQAVTLTAIDSLSGIWVGIYTDEKGINYNATFAIDYSSDASIFAGQIFLEPLEPKGVIFDGAFDGINFSFWDDLKRCYWGTAQNNQMNGSVGVECYKDTSNGEFQMTRQP